MKNKNSSKCADLVPNLTHFVFFSKCVVTMVFTQNEYIGILFYDKFMLDIPPLSSLIPLSLPHTTLSLSLSLSLMYKQKRSLCFHKSKVSFLTPLDSLFKIWCPVDESDEYICIHEIKSRLCFNTCILFSIMICIFCSKFRDLKIMFFIP